MFRLFKGNASHATAPKRAVILTLCLLMARPPIAFANSGDPGGGGGGGCEEDGSDPEDPPAPPGPPMIHESLMGGFEGQGNVGTPGDPYTGNECEICTDNIPPGCGPIAGTDCGSEDPCSGGGGGGPPGGGLPPDDEEEEEEEPPPGDPPPGDPPPGGCGKCGCPKETHSPPGPARGGTAMPVATANPINLKDGSVYESAVDLSLAGPGVAWSQVRTYDSQVFGGGVAGNRWMTSNEIYLKLSGTDVSLILNTSFKVLFTLSGSNYVAQADRNYTLIHDSANDKFIVTNQWTKGRMVFNDFTVAPPDAGKLIEATTLAWQGAGFVGDAYAYTGADVTQITTSGSQAYTIDLTYSSGKLASVTAKNGSDEIKKVEYKYFQNVTGASSDVGSAGDLVQVKRSFRDSSGDWYYRYTQYRYAAGSRLKGVLNHAAIQRIVTAGNSAVDDPEEIMQQGDDYEVVTDAHVAHYASKWFTFYGTTDGDTTNIVTPWSGSATNLESEYAGGGANRNEHNFVKTERIGPGGCPACGGSGVVKHYFYLELGVGTTADDNEVKYIVIEDTVDKADAPVYRRVWGLNPDGRKIRQAFIDNPYASPKYWCTSWKLTGTSDYTSSGNGRKRWRITEYRLPSAHKVSSAADFRKFLDPYDDASGGWTNDEAVLTTVMDNGGPTYVYEYNTDGRQVARKVKRGRDASSAYFLEARDYGNGTTVPKWLLTAVYYYPTKTTTKSAGIEYDFTYTYWDNDTDTTWDFDDEPVKCVTSTFPAVSTAHNGSGVRATTEQYFDKAGRQRWYKDAEGYVTYYSYHALTGLRGYVATDVNPGSLPASASDSVWVSPTAAGASDSGAKPSRGIGAETMATAFALVRRQEYDQQGRPKLKIGPGDSPTDSIYDRDYTLIEDLSEGSRTIYFPNLNASGIPQSPTRVTVRNELGQTTESYTIRGDYTAVGTASNVPTGFSAEPTQADYVSWTRYRYSDDDGRLVSLDRSHSIPVSGGTADSDISTYYYRTVYQYDDMDRVEYTIHQVSGSPTSNGVEQVDRTLYDKMGRVIEYQRGVSLAGVNMGADYDTYPTLVTMSTSTYDENNVGDSRLTKTRTYHTATKYTDVHNYYTYRGHLRGVMREYTDGSTNDVTPYHATDVDWKGRVTATGVYTSEPNWSTITGADGDTPWVDTATTGQAGRVAVSRTYYNELGHVYRNERALLNTWDSPPNGTFAASQATNAYRDRNGRVVGSGDPYAAHTEFAYDAVGRQYEMRTVTQLVSNDGTYGKYTSGGKFNYRAPQPNVAYSSSSAGSLTGGDDGVVELSHVVYDENSQVIEQHEFEMIHTDTNGIDLSNDDDYVRRGVYNWYDPDRRQLVTTADYGAGGTSGVGSWKYNVEPARAAYGSRPTTSSATVLVATFGYETATGRLNAVTSPGPGATPSPTTITTKTFYDRLARKTSVAENWNDYSPATSSTIGDSTDKTKDRVTAWQYDGLGSTTKLTAYNGGSGAAQETKYYYQDPVDASLISYTVYPDSTDTPTSGTDLVHHEYDRDGTLNKMTDQREVVHEYFYNSARQLIRDAATTIPTGVDDHVKSINYGYDSQGRRTAVWSRADTAGTGTVRNRIWYTYDENGRIQYDSQSHEGAGDWSSPKVWHQYDSSDTSGLLHNSGRLVKLHYPNGAIVEYRHGNDASANVWVSTDAYQDRLNQISMLKFIPAGGSSHDVVAYQYNGTARLVETDYVGPDVRKDMFDRSSGTPTSDYAAWDRFGRQLRSQWDKYGSGAATIDKVEYAYDYAGNRLNRNVAAAANDKYDYVYQYDALLRLVNAQAGTYSGGSIASRQLEQDWTLDAMGNWSTFKERDTDTGGSWDVTQLWDYSSANEMTTSISGPWNAPAHDLAGNMSTMPQPASPSNSYVLKWDAWNRLVEVKDNSTIIEQAEYDGLGRRIVRSVYFSGSLGYYHHYYYNDQWQVVEERVALPNVGEFPDPINQYVWHPEYVDALALRRYDENVDGSGIESHYCLQDANYNVTALSNSSGAVVERYAYTPYGQPKVLNGASDADGAVADWSDDADNASDVNNVYLYTGRERDAETGLQINRNRYLNSRLGRWGSRDPIGYEGSKWNLYEYVDGMPLIGVDPYGMCEFIPGTNIMRECDGNGRLTGRCFVVVGDVKVYVECPPDAPPSYQCQKAMADCESKYNSCFFAASASYIVCVKLSGGTGALPCTIAYLAWMRDCNNQYDHCMKDAMD